MQPEPEPEPAPPAIGADSAIHYSDGTSAAQSAPSLAAFEALVAGGEVTGASIVWVEGWQGWVPLAECAQRLGLRGGAAHSSLVELESIRVPREAVGDEGAAAVGDEAAAEKIQALARGWSARQRRTREEEACVRIQAAFRGHHARHPRAQPASSLASYVPPAVGNHKALFLFGPNSIVRTSIHGLVYNRCTEGVLLTCILINMLCMILSSPPPEPGSPLERYLWPIDTVFTSIFIAEFMLKAVACGFMFGENAYLRDSWNQLDFLVVVVSTISLLADLGVLELEDVSGAQGLRALRCLRPLRAAKFLPALRRILNAVASSLTEGRMQDVIQLLAFFFSIYAIMGMQMFGGSLRRHCAYHNPFNASEVEYTDEFCAPEGSSSWGLTCAEKPDALPVVAYECEQGIDCRPLPSPREHLCEMVDGRQIDGAENFPCVKNGTVHCDSARREEPMERAGETIRFEHGYDFVSFDSFGLTMITLFEICTLEGWTGIMYSLKDAEGPVEVYFISFLLICSLLMLDLIVGVICDAYAEVIAEEEEDDDEGGNQDAGGGSYVERRRRAHEKAREDGTAPTNPVRRCCQAIAAAAGFEAFILGAVMINTVMWATVHRGMPPTTLALLGSLDIIFIAIYIVEMLIKMGDLGSVFKYLRFSSNVFDFVVTMASIFFVGLDLLFNVTVNVTMLRALRCTRILNMSQGLRQILKTVTSSLNGVLGVMMCTIFFMVVYAVMGVQLFYQFSDDFGRESFATFGRGLLTLFQCITGEGWVDVMHAAMITSPVVAPLFFISYYILVNFVLVSIIIAIICANFELSEEEKLSKQRQKFQQESKKLASRQEVAKPFGEKYGPEMAVRKLRNLQSAGAVRLVDEEPAAVPAERAIVTPGTAPPPAQHLHERVVTAEPGALLDDREVRDINMIELLYDRSAELSGQNVEEHSLEEHTCRCCGVFKGIHKDAGFRVQCMEIAKHPQFERVILLAILVSCFLLALDTPNPAYVIVSPPVFFAADVLFLVIFTFECVVKIAGYGFYSHQYVGDPWNIPDFVILLSMWLEFLELATFSARAARILRVIRPLRLIKRNPGMRVILTAIGACIRPVANTLVLWFAFQFIYGILGVNLFAGKFLSCFVGEEGADVFGRSDCVGTVVAEDGAVVAPEWSNFGGQWYNFDHIVIAMVTLFEVASLEGWLDVMYAAMDIVELPVNGSASETILVQRHPFDIAKGDVGHPSAIYCLYFITFICLGTFIVINLLVGVFVDSFYQAKGIGLLTDEQRKWYDLRNLILKKHPKKIDSDEVDRLEAKAAGEVPADPKANTFRKHAQTLLKNRRVPDFFTLCIALNMVVLGAQGKSWGDSDEMPPDVGAAFKAANLFFVLVFVVEIALKIAAFPTKFWKRSWNRVDFFLMCVSLLEFIAAANMFEDEWNSLLQNLSRMFRPLRAIRLLEYSPGMRMLIRTFYYSIPAIANVTSLVMLFFFVYAVLGVQLYGTVQAGDALEGQGETHAHFGNFNTALSLVFRMATGEDWQAIMHDCAIVPEDGCGCVCTEGYERGMAGPSHDGFVDCAAGAAEFCGEGETAIDTCGNYWGALLYFISFFFLGAYCLMALFTAVVLDCFSVVNHVDSAVVNIDCMKQFKATWANFDPLATGYIPLCMLKRFVQELEKPLGFDPQREKTQWRKLYLQCLALHQETADDDEGMRLVEFNKLIELLAVSPFGEYLDKPTDHLEVKEQVRRDALLKRLEQENAASRLAAQWRGFTARKSMPMNTAVLQSRRTLHHATEQGSRAAAPRRGAAPAAPTGHRAHGTVENPLAALGTGGAAPAPPAPPRPQKQPQGRQKRVSPIDGTIEWVQLADDEDGAGQSWGLDHGLGNMVPSAPQSRDALRAQQRKTKADEV